MLLALLFLGCKARKFKEIMDCNGKRISAYTIKHSSAVISATIWKIDSSIFPCVIESHCKSYHLYLKNIDTLYFYNKYSIPLALNINTIYTEEHRLTNFCKLKVDSNYLFFLNTFQDTYYKGNKAFNKDTVFNFYSLRFGSYCNCPPNGKQKAKLKKAIKKNRRYLNKKSNAYFDLVD